MITHSQYVQTIHQKQIQIVTKDGSVVDNYGR